MKAAPLGFDGSTVGSLELGGGAVGSILEVRDQELWPANQRRGTNKACSTRDKIWRFYTFVSPGLDCQVC